MNSPMIQLIVLAAIALFLIVRLKNVLGTRDGFEGPPRSARSAPDPSDRQFEVVDDGPDHDIADHVPEGSEAALALAAMKQAEPSFSVNEFLQGARGAYEMILMAFERGKIDEIRDFLGPEVRETFEQVIASRAAQGLTVEAEFLGVHNTSLVDARFTEGPGIAEITVRFVGELTSVVRNSEGEVVGDAQAQAKRQKDTWTFERMMGSDDPNWRLVATE